MEKELVISNFKLSYDGMYHLIWDNFDRRVAIELNVLLRMIEIEGLSFDDIDEKIKKFELMEFKKAKVKIRVTKKDNKITSFFTSDYSDEYMHFKPKLILLDVELAE